MLVRATWNLKKSRHLNHAGPFPIVVHVKRTLAVFTGFGKRPTHIEVHGNKYFLSTAPLSLFMRSEPCWFFLASQYSRKTSVELNITSRLRRLVLCILHSIFFAKEKNKNAAKKYEGSLADICDVVSRDCIA